MDHLSKFVRLRALRTKRAEQVMKNLVDTFCTFRAQVNLQTEHGRDHRTGCRGMCFAVIWFRNRARSAQTFPVSGKLRRRNVCQVGIVCKMQQFRGNLSNDSFVLILNV